MILCRGKNIILQQNGFTLVEMAIVLLIIGFAMSAVAVGLDTYNRDLRSNKTLESIRKANAQLELFAKIFGYPCPADPTLGPGDAMYGRGDCDATNTHIVNVLGRDNMNVRVGAVPFADLADFSADFALLDEKYVESDGFDGWDNYLTYAVTFDLTDEPGRPPFDETMGAICIVDENNTSLLDEACTAHAVVISHGANGLGAYTRSGVSAPGESCIDLLLPAADQADAANDSSPNEKENCDHQIGGALADAKFVAGVWNESDDESYDDVLRFIIFQSREIWARGGDLVIPFGDPNDPTDDIRIPRVSSVNNGGIGIGLDAGDSPQQPLHLQGDLQADRVYVEELCDVSGHNCFDPELIGGDVVDMQCQQHGEVVQKIGRINDDPTTTPRVVCVNPFTSMPFTQCPPGQVVIGVSSVNGSICGTL